MISKQRAAYIAAREGLISIGVVFPLLGSGNPNAQHYNWYAQARTAAMSAYRATIEAGGSEDAARLNALNAAEEVAGVVLSWADNASGE